MFLLAGVWVRSTQSTEYVSEHVSYDELCWAEECIPSADEPGYHHEMIDRELALLQLSPEQVRIYHRRAGKYEEYIRAALSQAGLPEDLWYIAVAESALRERAVSSAGAAGLWQFMPETAQSYGLRVDEFIDERLDRKRSTQAAIEYLSGAYQQFGSRSMAAAAYNRGVAGMQYEVDRQYTDDYYHLRLNPETSRYVYRIVAIKYAMENTQELLGFPEPSNVYTLPKYKTVRVLGPREDMAARAREQGTSYKSIREYNPWLQSNILPEGERELMIVQ